jgi:hypothetical protein
MLTLILVALLSSVYGQAVPSLTGMVVGPDGRPISGVDVSDLKDKVTTGEDGEFRLLRPSSVIRFYGKNLEPKTLVISPGISLQRIVTQQSSHDFVAPACPPSGPNQKWISRGDGGIKFAVSEREVRILGGNPDADYVRYVIEPKGSESDLELWFGPFTLMPDPEDALFIGSTEFEQRNIVTTRGAVGIDSWGRLKTGPRWRQTAIPGEGGAIYRRASEADARVFDRIIDSMCSIPRPSKGLLRNKVYK